MKITNTDFLKRTKEDKEISSILQSAEKALSRWQIVWTEFFSAIIVEEALKIFSNLSEIDVFSTGGYKNAERKRLCFQRAVLMNEINQDDLPLEGLNIRGNFLFDQAKPADFREMLNDIGVKPESIGDIWITGDRGAQAICTPKAAINLNNKEGKIREVKIICEQQKLNQLQIPYQRIRKEITTVEASKRLDAIASAGFGLSRAKITNKIKEGFLRLNWSSCFQVSKELKNGDTVQLEGKGSIEILNIQETKKGRWRIELLRQ